jgi:hypothetical protein
MAHELDRKDVASHTEDLRDSNKQAVTAASQTAGLAVGMHTFEAPSVLSVFESLLVVLLTCLQQVSAQLIWTTCIDWEVCSPSV